MDILHPRRDVVTSLDRPPGLDRRRVRGSCVSGEWEGGLGQSREGGIRSTQVTTRCRADRAEGPPRYRGVEGRTRVKQVPPFPRREVLRLFASAARRGGFSTRCSKEPVGGRASPRARKTREDPGQHGERHELAG